MNVLLSILIVTGLLFGGGAAVSAAQDDLPNEPLYGLKTWTEDLSLQFQHNEEAKLTRLMELAQIRVQEMVQLTNNGEGIPAEVPLRLEQHIRQTLQLCANMDDAAMNQALLQLRERLQVQARVMEQLQLRTQDPEAVQIMLQTRTMLQQRLQLVDQGLQNGEMFREQVQNGFQFGLDDEFAPPVQNGDGQQQDGKPEEPGGPNPNPGEPNTEPGGPNADPGSPNPDPSPDPSPDPAPGGNGGNGNGSGGGGKP